MGVVIVGVVYSKSHPQDQGILVEYCAPSCGTTPFYLIWIGYTFLFKMALHVIAFVLWFRIRKIVVDTLNDYKFTAIIIYTSTVLIIVLVIVLVALVNYINVYGVMVPFLVFLEVLVFLLFTFVPKVSPRIHTQWRSWVRSDARAQTRIGQWRSWVRIDARAQTRIGQVQVQLRHWYMYMYIG